MVDISVVDVDVAVVLADSVLSEELEVVLVVAYPTPTTAAPTTTALLIPDMASPPELCEK
jgi:hypothetical protein